MQLRDLRERQNLTLYEVSLNLKVNSDIIAEWENGKTIPPEYLDKLAEIFQCTPEYILELQKNSTPIPTVKLENPQKKYNPIACPHCRSQNLAFVAEYHKELGLRGFESFLQIFLWFIIIIGIAQNILPSLPNFEFDLEELWPFIIASIILYIAKKIIQHRIIVAESKTHIQSICKDCGHFWLHG